MAIQGVDAIIIGAGMAGATVAANLANTHRVVLLEAEDSAGFHATGRSAAIWIRNYGAADVRILTAASKDFLQHPPEGFSETPLAHDRPVLHLAPPEQMPALEALLAGGAMIERIGVARAKAMVPALRENFAVDALLETDCFDIEVAARQMHQGAALFAGQPAVERGGRRSLRPKARACRSPPRWSDC